MSTTDKRYAEIQERLVRELVDLFNSKIEKNREDGHIDTKQEGDYFERKMMNLVQEYLSDMPVSVKGEYIRDLRGKWHQIDIVVKKAGSSSDSAILAVVEVKSFGDKTSFTRSKKTLDDCGLANEGFYFGVNGTMSEVVRDRNTDLLPKVFFLAPSQPASVRKKIKMRKPGTYKGVLLDFLVSIREQCQCAMDGDACEQKNETRKLK
jgi:hypothetical protein